MTETCPSCGARLTPGLEWCGQCFARLRPAPGGAAGATAVPGSGPGVPVPSPLAAALARPPAPDEAPPRSRWRAGPTSFGPLGRTLLSAGVFVLGVLGWFLFYGWVGIDGTGVRVLYGVIFVLVAVPMLARIWRPAPTYRR